MADNDFLYTEIDTILIKVASRCNINCTYCYVYNMGDDNWSRMSKFMSQDIITATSSALSVLSSYQEKPFSVVLHGGEPFLLGKSRLHSLLSELRTALPIDYPISIQTNGILISPEILDICSKFQVSVAVSIDGPKHVHDKLRVTHNGSGTFDEVSAGINILKSHPNALFLNSGLLAVVDPESEPAEVYQFFKDIEAPSVDFLLKDGNHDSLPMGKKSITSLEYGRWMADLLTIYLKDKNPLPIRVLDDMLKVMLGGSVSKEGLGVTDFGILIIDTDGTIMKNDTLKSSFNGADKFEEPVNVKDGNLIQFINSDAFIDYKRLQRPTHLMCQQCPQIHICGGGMILHRWSSENGFNNPSVYCADQLFLIKEMEKQLVEICTSHD